MPSSEMLCHETLVRTDVSDELIASIIRVRRIGELGTLAVTSNRARCKELPEHAILHSHRRENLKSYIDFLFKFLGMEGGVRQSARCKPKQCRFVLHPATNRLGHGTTRHDTACEGSRLRLMVCRLRWAALARAVAALTSLVPSR
jgi:hypothetical protein